MKPTRSRWPLCLALPFLLAAPHLQAAEPTAANIAAFIRYTQALEARLAAQHRAPLSFVVGAPSAEVQIEHLATAPTPDLAGAQMHHWRGCTFIPGATAADFERLLRDFSSYPQIFVPQVLEAHARASGPNHFAASLRIRQHHVLTVVFDTDYDVSFGQLDSHHGYSISRSTRIAEIDAAGTPRERALSPAEDHGFLWRLNSYWSYAEADGGLYLQLETVSLTRAIPAGLGWAIRPFVDSIPRESLDFTLRSAAHALTHKPGRKPLQ